MSRIIRRTLAGVLTIGALCAVVLPAQASAAVTCSPGQGATTYTRGGYQVVIRNYRSVRGMACSSVRYVVNSWLRRKLARQYGWPRLGRAFWDGYVTWHGQKMGGYRWRFTEYTTNTVFEFDGYVR